MSVDVFDALKQVPIEDVLENYGVNVKPNRLFNCPFPDHEDTNESFKFYINTNSFFCFGCGRGGDTVKFVQLMENVTPLEAARRLSSMFALDLFSDKPFTQAERQQIAARRKSEAARLEGFETWVRWAGRVIGQYLLLMSKWKEKRAPASIDDAWDSAFTYALTHFDYWEYFYEAVFINGGFEDQVKFYSEYRFEVAEIAEFIKSFREVNKAG